MLKYKGKKKLNKVYQRISTSFGFESLLFGANSKCTSLNEKNLATSFEFLETNLIGSGYGDPSYETSKITSNVVVSYSKHYQGHVIMASTEKSNHNNRCFENRVRRLPGQLVLSGNLVSCSEDTSYKCSKLEAVFLTLKYFQTNLKGQNVLIRSDSTIVSEQTGRHQVVTDVLQNVGPLEFGIRERDSH